MMENEPIVATGPRAPVHPVGAVVPARAVAGRHGAPRSALAATAGAFFVLALACNVLIIVASIPDATGLALALVAALLPTMLYALLVLSFDRYEREPWRNLLGAFGWGAVVATLLSIVLGIVALGVLTATLGVETGGVLAVVLGAPIIEETVKGLALLGLLLLYRDEFDGVLDGLTYGALIGLGFAMTENILYLGQAYLGGGLPALGQLFIAREVFGGLGHALYTGTLGAAVGWARVRYGRGLGRFAVPALGWLLAVAQHSLWNFGAARGLTFGGTELPLLALVAVQTAFFIIPGLGVLTLIAVRAGRAESRILHKQLADEVASGVLTPREYAVLSSGRLRHLVLLGAFRRGGLRRWTLQQQFFQAAADLALSKHHDDQGEQIAVGDTCPPEDEHRARLAALREALVAERRGRT